MPRLWTFALLVPAWVGASDEGSGLLERIRQNVAAQISRSANYACVETLERTYYTTTGPAKVCPQPDNKSKPREFMHDRLRLDIAVSEKSEIYSWHGENRFSSAHIDTVVHSGPISSGGFVGYLMNIFLDSGIEFVYRGKSPENGIETYQFNYTVSRPYTRFRIRDQSGTLLVPFHGSFSANAASLQLASLKIVADEIPPTAYLCGVETDLSYRIARISGFDSLIPASFDLRIGDRERLYTESHAEYLQCREFRGESTLRFDDADSSAASAAAPPTEAEPLPAGIALQIGLTSTVDDRTSYAGDPVEAVLLKPVKIEKIGLTIPANASLHGVVAELETHFLPGKSYYLRIEFERLSFADKTYSLRAIHKPAPDDARALYFLFGPRLPPNIIQDLQQGTMIFDARHFHLGRGFTGDWETIEPPPLP